MTTYPLHPEQTTVQPYYVEIPMEEYERLKRKAGELVEPSKSELQRENETLKKMNINLQQRICELSTEIENLRALHNDRNYDRNYLKPPFIPTCDGQMELF